MLPYDVFHVPAQVFAERCAETARGNASTKTAIEIACHRRMTFLLQDRRAAFQEVHSTGRSAMRLAPNRGHAADGLYLCPSHHRR
jgi:hypothetical protein